MIIGDSLIDPKVTSRPEPATVRDLLLQMVGYAMLDYSDRYRIRKAGVYLVRQRWMVTWPLWELMLPPADVLR
jgi:hypothetical protein